MKMQILLTVLGLMVLSGCGATQFRSRTTNVDGEPRMTSVYDKTRYGDETVIETVDLKSAEGGVPLGFGSHGYGPQVVVLPGGAPPTAAARAMEQIPYGGIALVPVPNQASATQPSAKGDKLIGAVKLHQGALDDHEQRIEKLETQK